MPTGKLGGESKTLWEEVYQKAKKGSCADSKDVEACAAKSAWAAIKSAGWTEDKDGNWSKKAELQEFSLRIERAGLDKPTGKLLWRMVASDTEEDSYNDSMSLELFEDFISRAKSGELVPEQFRSDFWSGGTPYLSISHYPDLNGSAVPGVVDAIFIDGNYFKAKGEYNKDRLGWACFEAVRSDLYDPKRQDANDKVRVSIAFLDYKHRHKSNDYVFTRSTMDDTCPECMKEMLEQILEHKESQGKEFLRGHLIHLAHTRVPVNKRTSMEVEKSMTTQKEDAASIVGEELANEIEEKAKAVTKSEALVIKSVEDAPIVEEAKTDKEKPKEDEEKDKEESSKKETKKADVVDVPAPPVASDVESIVRAVLAETQKPVEVLSHPLDTVLNEFKAAYDEVDKSAGASEEKLASLQPHFEKMVNGIRDSVIPKSAPVTPQDASQDMLRQFSETMGAVLQRLDLITARLTNVPQPLPSQVIPAAPVRRSIDPANIPAMYPKVQSTTPKLRQLVEATT